MQKNKNMCAIRAQHDGGDAHAGTKSSGAAAMRLLTGVACPYASLPSCLRPVFLRVHQKNANIIKTDWKISKKRLCLGGIDNFYF